MYLYELLTRVAAHVLEYQQIEERLPMSPDKLLQLVRVHLNCSSHSQIKEDSSSGDV
jgi:hypothetical protein